MLNNIITWCNINQGFVDAILSLFTFIASIIAIVISIITAKLPYKRKISVSGGTTIGVGFDFTGLHVSAVNVGNVPIMIKNIGIKVGKKTYININTVSESKIMLKPTETTSQYFNSNDLKIFNSENPYKKAFAYVEDTDGNSYKKYLGKVKNIQRFYSA